MAKLCHEGSGECGNVTKVHHLAGTVDLQTEQGLLQDVPASELRRLPEQPTRSPRREPREAPASTD